MSALEELAKSLLELRSATQRLHVAAEKAKGSNKNTIKIRPATVYVYAKGDMGKN